MISSKFIFLTVFCIWSTGFVIGQENEEYEMRYYTKDDPSVFHIRKEGIRGDQTPDGLKTIFIIHGYFTLFLEPAERIKDAYFLTRSDVARVVIVDWRPDLKKSESFKNSYDKLKKSNAFTYKEVALNNVPKVARRVADEVEWMIKNGMSTAENIEMVGHSLGAHIAGQAGRAIKEDNFGNIALITGLDPAKPEFEWSPMSIGRGDALKVRIIHTNTAEFGIADAIGDEDYYVNGGAVQKGCESIFKLKQNKCSHSKAWKLYEEGIYLKTFVDPKDPTYAKKSNKKQALVNVLVLDVSPSMHLDNKVRIKSLVVATNRYLDSLPIGAHVGVVIFGGQARTASPIVNISSEIVRESLRSTLPTINTQISATSIGAGLLGAISVVNKFAGAELTGCPNILLMTDGEENRSPYIRDVIPKLREIRCSRNSRVNTIALGAQADDKLEQFTSEFNGRMQTVGDEKKSIADIYDQLSESFSEASDSLLDPDERKIKLPSKLAKINGEEPTSFFIDETIGKDTLFTISSQWVSDIEAQLTTPNHVVLGPGNYTLNPTSKVIVFKIPDAKQGQWQIKINSSNQQEDQARIFVSSNQKFPEKQPIRLEGDLSNTTLQYPQFVTILANVRQGLRPVLFADVIASLLSPSGKVTRIKLLDNGKGADLEEKDGIYSRYITGLEGTGRFSVTIEATNGLKTAEIDGLKFGPFERLANAGSIKIIGNFTKPPPIPIGDLQVLSVDKEQKTCTLSWTAAGNEADSGIAATFYIRVSTDYSTINGNDDKTLILKMDSVIPVEAGETQILTVVIQDDLWANATSADSTLNWPVQLYFTAQSASHDGLLSQVSNVAPTYIPAESKSNSQQFTSSTLIFSSFVIFYIYISS